MRNALLLLPAFLVLACLQRREKTEAVAEPDVLTAALNDLPAMQIKLTDSTMVDVKKVNGKTVLVLFQPDCDHCQQEAQQIRDNLKAFSAYTTYFISS
jgi:protein-disulfide isomerase